MEGTQGKILSEEEKQEDEAKAAVGIWKYVFGFVGMAVVKCAIELGIAEALEEHGGGPMTLADLSSAVGCRPASVFRIMRFLVHRRIFKQTAQGSPAYYQTSLSRCLLKQGASSMAAFVLWEGSRQALEPWHNLSGRVRDEDASAFEAAHGKDVWRYAAENPGHSKLINEAMACDARVAVAAIVSGFPEVFDGVGSVVDVGGGDGTALRLLVKAFPWIRGISFDLPHVTSVAPDCDRVKHVGGNMFEKVPNADAAVLMWVLHDWGDDECVQVLQKCREAIPGGKGKVIIVEAVIGEKKEDDELEDVRLMLDMVMMAHTGKGKERTLEEWKHLIMESGFSRFTVNPLHAVQSVIVLYP
ncbi:hypothetical protein Nepgr_004774 [Nepenthes gracilis]|uniref:Uncharacterized protein n=1 Tax=Nepenthes gracilis TaxID=150966 RepID=A0AAD3S205_NEPGR|nr:hypothetical protein Nepgr_004774 [Nepenthes gracilis]